MLKGPKVLLLVDALRIVGQKINFELLTNEEREFVTTVYGQSEHLFQIVLNVYKRPSHWLKPGEESVWDRRVLKEIDLATKKNRRQIIIEMPAGHYDVLPLTYKGKVKK